MTEIVMMGVSGAGKTTVGAALARLLDAEFLEGDRFHPVANIGKMSRGEPLDDDDRAPWLDRLGDELARRHAQGTSVVLACSALKRAYRDRLRRRCPTLRLVYLKGERSLIRARLAGRAGHFMAPMLLDSQFAALEDPGVDENPIIVEVSADPASLVAAIAGRLRASPSPAAKAML